MPSEPASVTTTRGRPSVAPVGAHAVAVALLALLSTPVARPRPVAPASERTSRIEKWAAGSPPGDDVEWHEGKYAWAAVPAWARRCPAVEEALRDDGDDDSRPGVRVSGGRLEIERCRSGNGRWALYNCRRWVFPREGCDASLASVSGTVADPYEFVDGVPADPARAGAFAKAQGWELARPDDVRHAGSRAVLTYPPPPTEDEGTWVAMGEDPPAASRASGAFIEPPRTHGGRPRPVRPTLWTASQLRAAGLRSPENCNAECAVADGILVRGADAPKPVASCGRFVVYAALWRMRRGGGVFAVYDRAHDRHRWVLATPLVGGDYDANVAWRCGDAGFAVADGLRLDLERAEVRRVHPAMPTSARAPWRALRDAFGRAPRP